jgi:hypothetical protein
VIDEEVFLWSWDQCCEALDEFMWGEDEMCCAVVVWGAEPELDPAVVEPGEACPSFALERTSFGALRFDRGGRSW